MNSAFEIKELARRLGYDVPNGTDEQVLSYIANQMGFDNYIYSPENNEKLFSALKDVEHRQWMDDFWDDSPSGLDDGEVLEEVQDDYVDNETDDYDENTSDEDSAEHGDDDSSASSDNDSQSSGSENDKTDANNSDDSKSDEAKNSEEESDELKSSEDSKGDVDNKDGHTGKETKDFSAKSEKDNDAKANVENGDSKALQRQLQNNTQQAKSGANTAGVNNANKNLEHAKRMHNGNNPVTPVKSGDAVRGAKRTNDGAKKAETTKKLANGVKSVAAKTVSFFKNVVIPFLASHPWVILIVLGFILLFVVLIICFAGEGSSDKHKTSNGAHCSYDLSGVIASGNVQLDDVSVELINCSGIESNYTVLETVDFEKYVLGVALAEIGPDAPDEAIKSQIIAARNFALTRNQGMCPGNPDDCFYGYNASTGKIRMRACEADQVYWNYEKDIYREDRGAISIYSPEISSGTLWKSALSDARKQEVLALADEVKGKVLLDSAGNVLKLGYNATTSTQFINGANSGQDYEEILTSAYDIGDISSASCKTVSDIDYGDYVLSSDGDTILHEDLASFLARNGSSLEEFNQLISDNVDDAGYGTRAGVVAAAVTLIAELGNNYDVKIPYFWGGGHAGGIHDLASGSWGSNSCYTVANNQSYNYCGLDCSGFVPWAIRNGGFNMQTALLANQFQNISGAERVSLSSNSAVVQPGDILESRHHVVLVVGIDYDSKKYICAEASGNEYGIWFTRRSFGEEGYWGVKMDKYYDNVDNIRS